MEFTYCPQCGDKLGLEEIGDEGLIPFCSQCRVPYFDWFGPCIIAAVINEEGEIALLKQGPYWGLVAGHIKKGESLEETVIREVAEETGQRVDHLEYMASYYLDKKDLLMIGFKCEVKKRSFNRSIEIDQIEWFDFEKAGATLRPGTIAGKLMELSKRNDHKPS